MAESKTVESLIPSTEVPLSGLSSRMSVEEIARRLKVGRQTIYVMLERGILPGIRLGQRWLVTRYAYEEWEQSCGTCHRQIPVPHTLGLAVTPDGAHLYVASGNTHRVVYVVNTVTRAIETTVATGQTPTGAAVTPDGRRVYVTNAGSHNLAVIDTATNRVTHTIPLSPASMPQRVAITPDGTRAYVTNYADSFSNANTLSVIDTARNAVIAAIPVSTTQWDIVITPHSGWPEPAGAGYHSRRKPRLRGELRNPCVSRPVRPPYAQRAPRQRLTPEVRLSCGPQRFETTHEAHALMSGDALSCCMQEVSTLEKNAWGCFCTPFHFWTAQLTTLRIRT